METSNENKKTAEISTDEMAEFMAFKKAKAKKEAERRLQESRQAYKQMVDEEIDKAIPELLKVSSAIQDVKKTVYDNFRTILNMKKDLFKATRDGQQTFTFTNSKGDKRIKLGYYVTDSYRDTVEDGIAMVKDYISSLADNDKSRRLVNMVLRLLARDAKGELKASRVMQLRNMAEDSGDEKFIEGVKVIQDAYQPQASKQFITAQVKDPETGVWKPIALGMTEA